MNIDKYIMNVKKQGGAVVVRIVTDGDAALYGDITADMTPAQVADLTAICDDIIARLGSEEIPVNVSAPEWRAGLAVKVGEVYLYDGQAYQVIQAHTTQSDWPPPIVPALFRQMFAAPPGQEYPDWVQPAGGHDAYKKGDRVKFDGQNWESTIDANVWQPGVYGWIVV